MNCEIETDGMLASDQLESLILLYQPLMSFPSLGLYMTLYQYGASQFAVDIDALRKYLHISVDEFHERRKELEMLLLLKTYQVEGNLNFKVLLPLRKRDFFAHPILGRYSAVVVGPRHPLSLDLPLPNMNENSSEITAVFDLNRLSTWDETYEGTYQSKSISQSSGNFNVDAFVASLTEASFPSRLVDRELKGILEEVANKYQLNHGNLRSLLSRAYNRSTSSFNLKRFVYLVDEQFGRLKPSQVQDVFDMDPVSYLAFRQNHDYVADVDRNLLKSISKNYGFNQQVINVLINHVYDQLGGNLSKNYIEKIATHWKRMNVETKEEALKQTERITANYKKSGKQVTQPQYSQTSDTNQVSDEVLASLDALFGGGD